MIRTNTGKLFSQAASNSAPPPTCSHLTQAFFFFFFCRHVILPRELAKQLPKKLLSETEWRGIGVQQSRGWYHYAIHRPEPHILLFRRPLGTDPTTGKVDPLLAKDAKEKFEREFDVAERR